MVVAIACITHGCQERDHRVQPEKVDNAVSAGVARTLLSDELLQIFGTHVSPSISAEFTSDGKWIVVSGDDGVTIHDVATMACVNCLNAELIEVSPDGMSCLVDHPSGAPELRSIPNGNLQWRLPDQVATRP